MQGRLLPTLNQIIKHINWELEYEFLIAKELCLKILNLY